MFQLSIEKDVKWWKCTVLDCTDLNLTSLAVWSKGDNSSLLLGWGNIFQSNRRGGKHLKPTTNSLLRCLEMIWVMSVYGVSPYLCRRQERHVKKWKKFTRKPTRCWYVTTLPFASFARNSTSGRTFWLGSTLTQSCFSVSVVFCPNLTVACFSRCTSLMLVCECRLLSILNCCQFHY